MPQKLTFDAWMKLVDSLIQRKCGMSAYDLPDCAYHDWYDDGKSAASAAAKAVKLAKEF